MLAALARRGHLEVLSKPSALAAALQVVVPGQKASPSPGPGVLNLPGGELGEDPLAAPAAQIRPWFAERRNLLC